MDEDEHGLMISSRLIVASFGKRCLKKRHALLSADAVITFHELASLGTQSQINSIDNYCGFGILLQMVSPPDLGCGFTSIALSSSFPSFLAVQVWGHCTLGPRSPYAVPVIYIYILPGWQSYAASTVLVPRSSVLRPQDLPAVWRYGEADHVVETRVDRV